MLLSHSRRDMFYQREKYIQRAFDTDFHVYKKFDIFLFSINLKEFGSRNKKKMYFSKKCVESLREKYNYRCNFFQVLAIFWQCRLIFTGFFG
jgi:hypothetical protein